MSIQDVLEIQKDRNIYNVFEIIRLNVLSFYTIFLRNENLCSNYNFYIF